MIPSPHRPTWATIRLDRIRENIEQVVSHLPRPVKTFAVVKANAYGHGAVAVAQAIANQVDGFCVSNLDEAMELRQAGIDQMILVLGVVLPEAVPLAIHHQLTLTVTSLDWLNLAQEQAVNLSGLSVHIKVDSGMGRLGVRSWQESQKLMDGLELAGARVTGLFTHFATADEADTSYFDQQLANFKEHLAHLDRLPELIHTSNSATSIWHGETVFSAVRLGVVIYGLDPSGGALPLPYPIKPALTLSSRLVQVKTLEAGEAVGYGASYRTEAAEVIGTVPIGYADGYVRDLRAFEVLVDGHRCPLVGRVSMDQLTVRLPKVYPLGTEVTLIGENGGAVITATDVAEHCQTINYEVVCLLSDRVPRRYE